MQNNSINLPVEQSTHKPTLPYNIKITDVTFNTHTKTKSKQPGKNAKPRPLLVL